MTSNTSPTYCQIFGANNHMYMYFKILLREELRLGHSKKPAFPAMERVLQGDKRENVRAQLPLTGLTAEQQVAALIDQATDPNILGRVYAGWEPWM